MLLTSFVALSVVAATPVRITPPSSDTPGFSSSPSGMLLAGKNLYFVAATPSAGREPWVLDTSTGVATQLADIGAGPNDSNATFLTAAGDGAYFIASDLAHGSELWRTDGRPEGTVRVTDISSGRQSSVTTGATALVNGFFYFSATHPALGKELYASDGTSVTQLTEGLNPGAQSTIAATLVPFDGKLYFVANSTDGGTEWYRTATPTAVERLNEVVPGFGQYFVQGAGIVNGALVAVGGEPGSTRVYRIDAGSSTVDTAFVLPSGASPAQTGSFQSSGTQAFFLVDSPGWKVWRTDGTDGGTFPVTDTASVWPANGVAPALSGENYYFAATDAGTGLEVWVTDGTAPGTHLVADVNPGIPGASIQRLRSMPPDRVIFSATGPSGIELYVGTPDAGAWAVSSLGPNDVILDWMFAGGRIYFSATTSNGDIELWQSDGTPLSATLMANLSPANQGRLVLKPLRGAATFRGGVTSISDPVRGTELAALSADGGFEMMDLEIGSAGSDPNGYGVGGDGRIYFQATTSAYGKELWSSDGTASGTRLFADYTPGPTDSSIGSVTPIGNELYCAFGDSTSSEPSRINLADAGLTQIADLEASPYSSRSQQFTPLPDGGIVFSAFTRDAGQELFWTDGTPSGTSRISDFAKGSNTGVPLLLLAAGNHVFFRDSTVLLGGETFVTDGTAAGTQLLLDAYPGAASGQPVDFTAFDGRAYFTSQTPTGQKLFSSDGTPSGTTEVPLPSGAVVSAIEPFNDALFLVIAENNSAELWRLNAGATAPTQVSSFVHPGEYAEVADLFATPHALYFTANGADAGRSLYRTADGVTVTRADESLPNVSSSAPVPFLFMPMSSKDGYLYYTAISPEGSRELFRIPTDVTPPVVTHALSGDAGDNGYFTSDVTVTFSGEDPESGDELTACSPVVITEDTVGTPVQCTVSSRGGSTTDTVTVKRDTSAPVLSCPSLIEVERGTAANYSEVKATDIAQVELDFSPPSERFIYDDTEATVTATDEAGNHSSCTVQLKVITTHKALSHYEFGCSATGGAMPVLLLLIVFALLKSRRSRKAQWSFLLLLPLLFATEARADEKPTVLFTTFKTGVGIKPDYADSLTEYAQSELIKLGAYKVTGAAEIKTLIGNERTKSLLGCSDEASESCLAELGGALNASRIVSGDVSYLGDSVVVNLYLLDQASAKVIAREGVRRGREEQDALLDDLREAVRALVEKDPAAKIQTSGVSSLMAGIRADADVANIAASPSLTAELASRWVGLSVAAFLKKSPGGRLEGRFYPIVTSRVRPYLAAGASVMSTGVGVRGAVGGTIQLGSIQLFADAAYERFVINASPDFANSAILIGAGAGWAF